MINNLLKPLLSKPETIHIQRKYETFILIILSCNLTTSSETLILHLFRQWVASSCSTCSVIGLLHQRHGKIDRSAKNLPGTFFGSHDTYVTTYEAMRISPFTRIEFPSSFFFGMERQFKIEKQTKTKTEFCSMGTFFEEPIFIPSSLSLKV